MLVQPAAEKTHTFLRPDNAEGAHSVSSQGNSSTESREPSPATIVRCQDSAHSFPETSSAYAVMHRRIECHNLVQAFLLNCFPSHWPPTSRSWIPLLDEISTQGEALEISSAAVAASALGYIFHDHALVKLSLKYYTQGLHQLQRGVARLPSHAGRWNPGCVHGTQSLRGP